MGKGVRPSRLLLAMLVVTTGIVVLSGTSMRRVDTSVNDATHQHLKGDQQHIVTASTAAAVVPRPSASTAAAAPVLTAAPLAPRSTTPTGAMQCKDLAARGTWTSDVTHPGLEVERWWAAKEGPNRAGHFNTTGLSGCQYTMLKSDEIRECLRGKKVVVIGDSIVRNVLSTLLMLIYPDHPMPVKIHEDWSKTPNAEMGTEFHFLWRAVAEKFEVPDRLKHADNVLFAMGIWEMASGGIHAKAPRSYYDDLVAVLKHLEATAFAPKQRTFLTIHNVTREDHRVCYTGARVAAFRRAASCAVGDSRQPWSMLDYTDATSTAPPAHWDPDWTHITGTLNEGLVHMWLNGMCGFASGPFASECAGVSGAESGASWKTMAACDFNNPS